MRSADDTQGLIRPIASLISKSEKAQQKLTPGTWQHTMLQENLRALHLASALMSGRPDGAEVPTREHLRSALSALADMISKSKMAQARFSPGTAQYALQENRLRAFRAAEKLMRAKFR